MYTLMEHKENVMKLHVHTNGTQGERNITTCTHWWNTRGTQWNYMYSLMEYKKNVMKPHVLTDGTQGERNETWLRLYRVRYPPLWDKPKRPCCLKCAHICLFAWCACAPIHNWYIHNLLKKKGKIAIWDLLFICVAGIGLPGQIKKKLPLGICLSRFSPKIALGAIAGGIFRSHFWQNWVGPVKLRTLGFHMV